MCAVCCFFDHCNSILLFLLFQRPTLQWRWASQSSLWKPIDLGKSKNHNGQWSAHCVCNTLLMWKYIIAIRSRQRHTRREFTVAHGCPYNQIALLVMKIYSLIDIPVYLGKKWGSLVFWPRHRWSVYLRVDQAILYCCEYVWNCSRG